MTEFLVKSFGEMATCYYPSSHCIPDQKFISVSTELNHNCWPWVLDFVQMICYCLHPLNRVSNIH